jgi:toxin ParE1/3/4
MAPPLALTWSAPALDDLDEIAAHIALDKPAAAAAFVQRVLAAVERLREHPSSGRRLPELPRTPYREVIVSPCRIVYRRDGGTIFIVYVFRGERQLRRERLRGP